MTEHLPECPVEKMLRSGRTVGSQSCICEHLRACEERVIKSANLQYFTSEREAMTQMDRSWNTALVKALHLGYQDALDDVQDRLKDMKLRGWQRHALDELRKP